VRDALLNPAREKLRLVVTRNALDRLGEGVSAAGLEPEIADPRKFPAPLDPGSVHQGAALEVRPLDWGSLEDLALGDGPGAPRLVLLDRVSDPHNVGAILRSAEVFGARAVVAPAAIRPRKPARWPRPRAGALERQPYLRVPNLGNAIETLKSMGYLVIGLDGEGPGGDRQRPRQARGPPGGAGVRAPRGRACARAPGICAMSSRGYRQRAEFGSLNVSNAAAVSLYA
jgi:23S rRNA (guanosine2251-2'-O)-methyltransferase